MAEPRNSIRTYALVAVSVSSVALIGYTCWLIYLLGVSDWCGRAIGAVKATDSRPEFAVSGCFSLLRQQVSALSIDAFIALGTLALCLAVLVVIVIAGGKLSFKASKDGIETSIDRDPAAAAQATAQAAVDKADDIADKAASGT